MNRLKTCIIFLLLGTINIYCQLGEWEIIGNMNNPVAGAGVLYFDNCAYVIGGYAESTQNEVEWIQKYTFDSGDWFLLGYTQFPRKYLVAELYKDTSVFIYGGSHDSRAGTNDLEKWKIIGFSSTDLYDYNANFNRIHGQSLLSSDYLYLIGGNEHLVGEHSDLPYICVYNIPLKQFEYIDTLNYVNTRLPEQQMVESIGDDIFIFGGVFNGIHSSIYKFNITTKSYDLLPISLSVPRAAGTAIKTDDGRIFIIGGYNEQNNSLYSTEIFEYNGNNYSIVPGPNLNVARKNLFGVSYNNAIYIFGGFDDKDFVISDIEKLYIEPMTSSEEENISQVENFRLIQNHPNPFNPATTISFQVQNEGNITLDIFSISGKYITTLAKGNMKPGRHDFLWEGKDKYGNQLPSGVYLYRLTSGLLSQTKKMLLLK